MNLTPWYPPHIKPVRVDEKISYCRECFGKGWNDNWRKISSHYMGGEVFREECESCAGTGLAHPPQNNHASCEKK